MELGVDYYAFVYDGATLFNSSGTSARVFDAPWWV